jgi:hypothetical protein
MPGRSRVKADRIPPPVKWSGKWKRRDAVLFRRVLDDVVVLVPGPEPEAVALAGGAALWSQLERPQTTSQLAAALTADIEDRAKADADLDELLSRLVDLGAVDRVAD